MLVLTLRTDQPDAEISLLKNGKQLTSLSWRAHRQLAETIHQQIRDLLTRQGLALDDLEGIVVFRGPGSFTGLRIGISVANALADSKCLPIIGDGGDNWELHGYERLLAGENEQIVIPEYGSLPHTTQQKR